MVDIQLEFWLKTVSILEPDGRLKLEAAYKNFFLGRGTKLRRRYPAGFPQQDAECESNLPIGNSYPLSHSSRAFSTAQSFCNVWDSGTTGVKSSIHNNKVSQKSVPLLGRMGHFIGTLLS